MILITSAAYVEREFQIEFGALPPTFLPIENLRLFELQIRALNEDFPQEKIILSLPASYSVSLNDRKALSQNGVDIVFNEDGLSLGTSIEFALKHALKDNCCLKILHGDTLISGINTAHDSIGIGNIKDGHSWELDNKNISKSDVWCGYFSFADAYKFLKVMSESKGDFVSAVRNYDALNTMKRFKPNSWLDFGHISTYFQSRSMLTTQRSFNSLTIKNGSIIKSGTPPEKIRAEYTWFKNLNDDLLVFAPQLTSKSFGLMGSQSYQIEYLPLPPLNEIFVHGRHGKLYWKHIFFLVDEFLNVCSNQLIPSELEPDIKNNAKLLISDKTFSRLETFSVTNKTFDIRKLNIFNGNLLPSILEIVNNCLDEIPDSGSILGVSHGDLCLSNLLFDSRIQRIKVIDPRGLDYFGAESSFGDLRYDIAKLNHSILGLYDHIIAGSYDLEYSLSKEKNKFEFEIFLGDEIYEIQNAFKEKLFLEKVRSSDVMPITILLFLSMLPLHLDKPDRQMAFLANALRLYSEMFMEDL